MSGQFESMLATAMRLSGGDTAARAASWRQLIDIVAQADGRLDVSDRAAAFERLHVMRGDVELAERRMAAASLAGRTRDPLVAATFAQDVPSVAGPFLSRAALDDDDWRRVIPTMPATSRNILRNRRDLPEGAQTMLARFALADLTLPPSDEATAVPESAAETPGVTQIRDLVDRIAAYRQRMPEPVAPRSAARDDAAETISENFLFETGTDGVVDWVEGADRTAIFGATVAEVARPGAAGVDGQAAGAWRRRAPFTDARLFVSGVGTAGGDWLITAAPLFNPRDGRFLGYRGSARRPRPDERAGGTYRGGGIAPDSLRQLVHELRTPLGAIQGFAEMIDKQVLGPAALHYREQARAIMGETERLVAMVDDLDTSARLDTGRLALEIGDGGDLVAIAHRWVAQQRGPLAARDVTVALACEVQTGRVTPGAALVERMVMRLLSASTAVAAPGERIEVAIATHLRKVILSVARPQQLLDRDENALLDPGYGPDGDWPDAPLLGLGFTLRLVARLATHVGGRLSILPDRFVLGLPHAARQAEVLPA